MKSISTVEYADKKGVKRSVVQWHLVVLGQGEFPLDMLRYDSAFPTEQEDSAKLQRDQSELRTVVLTRRGINNHWGTQDRWKSFGWTIVAACAELGEARNFQKKNFKI